METSTTNASLTQTAVRAIKNAGVSATLPRVAVWTILAKSDRPLQAVEIKRRVMSSQAGISLSSVYSVLKRLCDANLVSTHAVEVGKAHFSLTTQNFCQRIICDQTGKELWLADPELTQAIEAFCQKHGFDLSEYTLLAQGRCATAVKRRGGAPEAAVASMAG